MWTPSSGGRRRCRCCRAVFWRSVLRALECCRPLPTACTRPSRHGTTGAILIVTTTNEVNGYRIVEYKGVVRGLVVRATSVVAGVTGGLKSMFGGNISEYEKVCEKARDEAFGRMVGHAKEV